MNALLSCAIIFLLTTFSYCETPFSTSGFYTDDIDSGLGKYEIVYPEKVSKDGSFVSFYLPHYYNLESFENRPRRTSGHRKWHNGDEIHFFVPIGGEKQHLELWPNWNFLASGLVVERRDARDIDNINKAKISQISQKQCHYSGEIVGQPNSSVALSTCYGLAGYIRVPAGDEYLIEPLKDTKPTKGKEHPHIIYKRSGKKDPHGVSNCLTRGRAKDALAERQQWETLFGDQVRRELSGINMNELVLNTKLKTSQYPMKNKLSETDFLNGNFPQVGKSSDDNDFKQYKDRTNNMNDMPNEKFNQVQDFQEMQNSGNLMENSFHSSLKNSRIPIGDKLKHKSLKSETNMGNIKLPDVDLSPVKSMPNKLVDDYSIRDYETSGHKKSPSSIEMPGHNRIKRNVVSNNEDQTLNLKTNTKNNEKQLNCDYKINSKNNYDSKTEGQYQQSPINEIDGGSLNVNFLENPNENSEKTEVLDKGVVANAIQDIKITDNSIKSKSNENGFDHERGVLNSVFDKRELNLQTKKKLTDTNFLANDCIDKLNNKELKNGQDYQKVQNDGSSNNNALPSQILSSGNQDKLNKLEASLKQANEKNVNNKRDIHLDTSEKSWKINDSEQKSSQDKSSKACNSKETSEGISDKMENSLKNLIKNVENTSGESSKACEEDGGHQKTSNKEIASDSPESTLKDEKTSKVKKEISFGENSEDIKYNLENEHLILPNVAQNQDNNIKFDQISLKNSQDNLKENNGIPKSANTKQNFVFINKEKGEETSDEKNLYSEVKRSDLGIEDTLLSVDNKQNSALMNKGTFQKDKVEIHDPKEPITNGETIIIKIKAPEGTVSEIKQSNAETRVENMNTKNAIVQNDAILKGSEIENDKTLNVLKTLDKTSVADVSKRGIVNKLDDNNKLKMNNYQPYAQEPLVDGNKKEQRTGGVSLEIHQQEASAENNLNKPKTKRDNPSQTVLANAEKTNSIPKKEDLFCKGESCLDIKPFLFNSTGSINSNEKSNANKNNTVANNLTSSGAENIKSKLVEKRQAWDECASDTTTELPLLCFDFENKMFNLELMVTVDFKVVKMHEDDDIENFILTIINMVSTNFYDKTIGINLSVFLVRMIILTTCIKELDSDRFNPEELLENFCTWQVLINPGKDDHPHHHDLAIFVTRMDKCEGQVLGVSYMTSICRPDRACLVCVDEGLLLANTITHQIGHALGADHDESENSGCSGCSPDGRAFHMSPTITETSSAWSECSRDSIIQFVKTQGSWCLSDLPVERQYHFPIMLPGQIYSAAQQCRLNFHMTTVPCSIGAFCDKLYCQVTEKLCATKGDPPADGTFCAADMWCFHKECVHVGRRPGSVNGEWGPWTEWSLCTRSCGGGVLSSYRICNNPKPENGGRYCVGERIRHRMCATKPCTGFSESFRDLQCKKTEDRPFRGRYHNWVQYQSYFLNIECALVCQNRKGDVVMRSPIVADGTPCKPGTQNVCIQGMCRNVGCDWVIDSNTKEDACGICRGNGTECRIIQGAFTEETTGKGEVEFLRIPKGSGMIFIREIAPSANVVVVSGAINKIYYLNGQGSEDSMPGDISFGTAHGVYEVRSGMERIFVRGPTSEDLVIYLRFREQNKGIQYQYAIPEVDPTYSPRYLWQFLDWDPCTDPCSGGSQRARAKCVEDRGGVVDDQYCTECSRPIDVIRPCNDFPCLAKWWVSVWSDCICTGSASVMFRSVLCMRATDESGTRAEIVKESECSAHKKPPTQKSCNASEDDECAVKRSLGAVDFLSRSQRDIRRALSPKDAFSAYSPVEISDLVSQDAELISEPVGSDKENEGHKSVVNKNQKKSIKSQTSKIANSKEAESTKSKPDESDKEGSQDEDNKNVVSVNQRETGEIESDVSKVDENKESNKQHTKEEDAPISPDKGRQIVKLKSKSDAAMNGEAQKMKNLESSKQTADESKQTADESCDEIKVDENVENSPACESTTAVVTCRTLPPDTTEPTTCRQTCPNHPHRKTTCCKTPPRDFHTKPPETTTMRPVPIKLDEVNLNNLALTVVPLDLPGNKKKLPQTDPEFINLGNLGQFGVGDDANATILTGQDALDFLEFARSNASEEPVILHEDMNN